MAGRGCVAAHLAWDEEGFPVAAAAAALRRGGGALRGAVMLVQDRESGEWVVQQQEQQQQQQQQQAFFLHHRQERVGSSWCDGGGSHWPQPRLQRIIHVHYPLSPPASGDTQHCGRQQRQPRVTPESWPLFRVPAEVFTDSLPQNPGRGDTRIVYISVWKEFVYAPSVLLLEPQRRLTYSELRALQPVTHCLAKVLNRTVVDWSLYVFFFGVYFLYCCVFHNLLELGLYLLFGSHLSIHHLASCANIDVAFKGSMFQGPAYALIRMFCQHCTQRENARVMWRHVARMRRDIMNTRVT